MTAPPQTPAKNRTYNLLSALEQSLHNVWRLETYATDAERQGDPALAEWFRKMQHNNQKAADQGKHLLLRRLETEGS